MVATKRRFDPNLQKVRILVGKAPRRVYVCTRCLKAGKVTKALQGRCAAPQRALNPRITVHDSARRRAEVIDLSP